MDSFSSEKLRVTSEISYLCSLLVYLCFIFSCLAYRCDLIEFGYNLNWILFGLGIASITLTVCGVATGIIGWAIRRTVSTRVTGRGSWPEVFCKKGALKNFAKFTGKHLLHKTFPGKCFLKIPKLNNNDSTKMSGLSSGTMEIRRSKRRIRVFHISSL